MIPTLKYLNIPVTWFLTKSNSSLSSSAASSWSRKKKTKLGENSFWVQLSHPTSQTAKETRFLFLPYISYFVCARVCVSKCKRLFSWLPLIFRVTNMQMRTNAQLELVFGVAKQFHPIAVPRSLWTDLTFANLNTAQMIYIHRLGTTGAQTRFFWNSRTKLLHSGFSSGIQVWGRAPRQMWHTLAHACT